MAEPVLVHTSILNNLSDALVDQLTARLKLTGYTDSAAAGLVRAGKLQDDPTTKKINILVRNGGIDWPDELFTPDGAASAHEIGSPYGKDFWKRRFIIELQLFYVNENKRDYARQKTSVVVSRAIHALRTQDYGLIDADSFGESAYACYVIYQHVDEGGGVGDFNWRGKIYLEYHTEITYTDLE